MIVQKCFADAIKYVATSRAEDATLEARLHDNDIGVSTNTACGWLRFKHFAALCDVEWDATAVSVVSVDDSEPKVIVERCQ